MGLANDLGYKFEDRKAIHRGVAGIFATRQGAWVGARLVPPLDGLISRLTDGQGSITGWLAGLPPLWLTTTGAKTGANRQHPLFGFPITTGIGLIGSNFGQERHPAWVYNLEANPEAQLAYGARTVSVRSRPASPSESVEIWQTAIGVYPGYAKYRNRASHREIRVFILEAV